MLGKTVRGKEGALKLQTMGSLSLRLPKKEEPIKMVTQKGFDLQKVNLLQTDQKNKRWEDEEIERLHEAYLQYGNKWASIQKDPPGSISWV